MNASGSPRARTTLSWGLIDQIIASGANFLFVVIAARTLDASGVGAVAFTFELYVLSVFVARGIAGDPLTSRFSGLDDERLRDPMRRAATTALVVGVAIGAVVAGASLFVSEPLRGVMLVAAIALPGLALQDFARSALIVQGRVRAACFNDALWALTQLPAFALVILVHDTPTTVFGAWVGTGCLAGAVGLLQLRCGLASPRVVGRWLRETRDLWPYYLADNLVYQLTTVLMVLLISGTSGLAAVAGFRVAMTVYSPLSLAGRGVISVSVAMLARLRDDPDGVRRRALTISAVLTPMALGWGLVMLLVPTGVGEAFFGDSWSEAEPLVFLASFVTASGLFGTGVVVGLRALGAGRQTLVGRLVVSIGAAAAAAVGGSLGGAHGVFLALAWIFPVQATVWWLLLRHAARRRRHDVDAQANAST